MKKAVVTGGAGFIGSHMVDLLIKKGFVVKVIDNFSGGHEKNIAHNFKNKNFEFEKIDICNLPSNHSFFSSCDYVFHFAGIGDIIPSINDPIPYIKTNVIGTSKVLEASRKAKIKKFLYAASSSCYGIAETPTKETHKIKPLYPYALSKYLGENLCFHWHQLYNLPVNSIRIFNAYGPRVRTTGAYGAVFGVFLKQKLEKKPFTITGNGNQKRDFIYVSDVVSAFLKAAETKVEGEVFNLGNDRPQSINYLIDILEGEKVFVPKRPGEPDITHANIDKIKKLLNWEPKISFQEGVKKMMTNIENWKDAPLWTVDKIEIATKDWFKYLKKYEKFFTKTI